VQKLFRRGIISCAAALAKNDDDRETLDEFHSPDDDDFD